VNILVEALHGAGLILVLVALAVLVVWVPQYLSGLWD